MLVQHRLLPAVALRDLTRASLFLSLGIWVTITQFTDERAKAWRKHIDWASPKTAASLTQCCRKPEALPAQQALSTSCHLSHNDTADTHQPLLQPCQGCIPDMTRAIGA